MRSRTSVFGPDLPPKLPPPPQPPSVEPCPRQGAATYLAPCVITPAVPNQMPPRNRRSLIPPRRPSTSPRLPPRMAAHSPQLSKRLACRGKQEEVARGPNERCVISHCCALSTFPCHPSLRHSDVGMCRICHEGGGGETLLSPCDCTGTLGKVHKSCLEKWLSSSNTSYCELCHTEFTIERRPQPLTQVGIAMTFSIDLHISCEQCCSTLKRRVIFVILKK